MSREEISVQVQAIYLPKSTIFLSLKYPMVIYTPVCIYNHGEYFYNILTRKLVAEVLKLFILCWTRDTVPVQAIYLPKSTIFLLLKCVMVIWKYSPWLYIQTGVI